MMLGMLWGYHGAVTAQGRLLQSRSVVFMETDDQKSISTAMLENRELVEKRRRQVFLFEQTVIVASIGYDALGKAREFEFERQIKTNGMALKLNVVKRPVSLEEGEGVDGGLGAMEENAAGAEAATAEGTAEATTGAAVTASAATTTTVTTSGAATSPSHPIIELANGIAIGNEAESQQFFALLFESAEMKEEWTRSVTDILRMQQDMMKMLQNPTTGGGGGRGGSLLLPPEGRGSSKSGPTKRRSFSLTRPDKKGIEERKEEVEERKEKLQESDL